jgi:3-methyladenine DNA glycosylase AlkD
VTAAPSRLDIDAEVAAITATLIARRDPDYEWGMRRTVPSQQPAHATRVPMIQKTAAEWKSAHRDAPNDEVIALADALWATGWREERRVGIELARRYKGALAQAGWQRLEDWSSGIDNWELVDHLAELTGALLLDESSLLGRVQALSKSENPWQRRLVLVTLIRAFTKGDGSLRVELTAMAAQMQKDPHPLVRRAFVWARDRLGKDHLDG